MDSPYAHVPLPPTPAPARSHAGTPGTLSALTTDGVRPAERLDYWHQAHLGRMVLSRPGEPAAPFDGRVRRVLGADTHLLEHASDALNAERGPLQCRRDGVDYVSMNLMLSGGGVVDHRGQQRVHAGSLVFIDSALPVSFHYTRHQSVSIFLPRTRVREVIGRDPAMLPAGFRPESGIGEQLKAHLRMAAQQAVFMTGAQRVATIAACTDLALAALQSGQRGTADVDAFGGGIYQAARRLIAQRCNDPELGPACVAQALGCSRASLYRLFFVHGESVAAMIWSARLARAKELLASPHHAALSLSEVAFQSGFTDPSGFSRMFKRRYAMTPGEAREAARPAAFVRPAR